jgi:hypothetical protein
MKRLILFVTTLGALIFMASYTVLKTSGSHPGSTGAPGDLTCAQYGCHVKSSVMQDAGLVNTLLFSSNDTTYIPGNTYTLALQVTLPNIQKFGFELVALKDSTNTNIGNFILMDPVRTQILNYQATATDLRYSVTHQSAGTTTATAGAIEWKMKWTAPPANVGPITFWYATNCTNNDGQNTGDSIFLSSFQIKPHVQSTGLKEESKIKNLNVRYDREQQTLQFSFKSAQVQDAQVVIYDINGKLVLDQKIQTLNSEQDYKLRMPDNLPKGAYIVKLGLMDKQYTGKVLID